MPIEILVRPNNKIFELKGGTVAREWVGVTERGVPVSLLVVSVGVDTTHANFDENDFGSLEEHTHRPPRIEGEGVF